MKKANYLLILLITLSGYCLGQQNDSLPNAATIQGLKMAFITKQLNITTEEGQKFWPMYFNYMGELKKAKQDKKDDIIGQEETVLAVRKKYKTEFKKVLDSDERVSKMLTIDRDFNNVLRKELQQRMQMRNNRKAGKQ